MQLHLNGSKVLITGASRGIGRAIAEVFAEEGADLAVCARTPEPLKQTAKELRRTGACVVERVRDVTSTEQLRDFVDQAAGELGGIDAVVSNVSGGGAPTPGQWERNFTSDLMPFVQLAEFAEPHLAASAKGGSVVLVSSTSALHVSPPSGPKAYGPMKAALNHYAAALARKWARQRIRVNTVSPGPVEFEGGGWAIRREREPEYYASVKSRIPTGRLGRPAEIARAVAFLASPVSGFTTGANLVVDGGFLDRV